MTRALAVGYGVLAYLAFLGSFTYGIAFLANAGVPKTVDSGPAGALGPALAADLALLALFAVPHSVMARQAFKRRWTRIVPAPLERTTYVLVASLLFALVFWQWRPIPHVLWSLDAPAARYVLHGLSALGWAIVLLSTFMIDHFDLTGLRQVYCHFTGEPYAPGPFKTAGFYRYVRHPLMFGLLVAFWAVPHMSAGHLVFSGALTAYIFVGTTLEERDLLRFLGDDYRRYRERVPMILPRPGGR